jgi:hypothetical protein
MTSAQADLKEHTERCRELEKQLAAARHDVQEAEARIESIRGHEAGHVAGLARLDSSIGELRASVDGAVRQYVQQPLSSLDIEQAHAVCSTIVDTVLPLEPFQSHGIDGSVLLQLTDLDLRQLLQLKPVGLRHRLLHCIRRSAAGPAPELLSANFAVAEDELQILLASQPGITAEHAALLADAKVDKLTCGDVTADQLAELGIPFAARKTILLTLQGLLDKAAQGKGTDKADSNVSSSVTVERAVLEQVVSENKQLSDRLACQTAAAAARIATVPDEYLCPITCEIMVDPVLADDGQTYERKAIVTWIAKNSTSPITQEVISDHLVANRLARASIERWQKQQSK